MKEKIIDFKYAKELFQGKEDVVHEMLAMLAEQLITDLSKLQQLHAQNNWQAIKELAHKLHGGAGYCGALRLKLVSSHLENAIMKNENENWESLYQQLLMEINILQATIKNKTYLSF